MFVDETTIEVTAGRGGDGVTSFHREKYRPRGGPDGGNGGRGGDVVLVAEPGIATLVEYHFHPHQRAQKGRHGQGSNRQGGAGDDLLLPVPVGTLVRDEQGTLLVDLAWPGARFVAAKGGRGGRGNTVLTVGRRVAHFHEKGEPGRRRRLTLELRLLADAGLVGFPNAGKSSIVGFASAAKPRVADYPFTTLEPVLGVVRAGAYDYVLADVPGLIPGAAAGKGLGHRFLRHVTRSAVLVHVLDLAPLEPGRDPEADLAALEAELA
ncbi:MAG TPA: GTPase ObgE, partial [Actinomycetota bacterium]